MPKLDGVRDTTVFMAVAKLKGTGTLDLSVTAKLLAPYESLLKHHESIWNQRGGVLKDTDAPVQRMRKDFKQAKNLCLDDVPS